MESVLYWGTVLLGLAFGGYLIWLGCDARRQGDRLLDAIAARPRPIVWITLGEDRHLMVHTALSASSTREVLTLALDAVVSAGTEEETGGR